MTSPIATDDPVYDDQKSALVVSEDGASRHAAHTAVDHADFRLIDAVGFGDSADRLVGSARLDTILIETAGVAPEVVESSLATIDIIARDREIDLIVALDGGQVDLVTSRIFGRHAQLLCDASIADRVAALRWAGALRGHTVHDSARDADERLRKLNAEVARFAETLSQLSADRAQPRFGQVRDTAVAFRAEPTTEPVTPTEPGEVRDVIRSRRMRSSHFPDELFADPAWDMLLDLYAAELENRRVSVSSLCIAAAVPGTTALRWIGSMVEARLFERYADPNDRRRAFITLSEPAREGMQRYFHAVRRAGLAPA